ncbi:MAG: hypothetical protein XD49_1023 [Caldanaerobacter subterraneus]|jgi:hypothetical protein|uniref:Uncharacterized protein n=1 Tax=Caldanaerobacter subterraneus subsp. yonseiensis KB-1 TaxID=1388761 RepID=U5CSF2_CALSX|nr:hypothetical protein O163_03075 [Caldanaerobacter subterraneus subsp. yonseiensis KB-1]KUK08947.1 MAG: hypothetical protein XD49_1023 [Caldanaerobacter subterraneus]MDI3519942.1 hypothetical protein [Caldanaerobacter sp.]
MTGKSRYRRLVKASSGGWEPSTVAGIEWAREGNCEIKVAVSGEPTVKKAGYREQSPYPKEWSCVKKVAQAFHPFGEMLFL